MSVGIVPFSIQLPAGFNFSNGGTATPGTATATATATPATPASPASTTVATSSTPVDVISISSSALAGGFTAKAGDTYRMGDLFLGSAAAGQTIAGYRVALGDGGPSGGGQLWLGSENVTGQTSFTADEFARLTYVAGAGDQQSLTVAAQTGTPRADGTLSGEIDSPAVQITASVTGVRSLNAMGALSTLLPLTDADAGIASVAAQAGIFTGFGGAARPTLQTDGNFTANDGDTYRMSDLFQASGAAGQTIAGYRVALGDGGASGGGQLWLGSENVTGQTSFSADEFARLTYVTGAGDAQSLTVAAQTGTPRADGTLAGEIDSPAVQITASVTGVRSINAMGALSTLLPLTDADAAIAAIAAQTGIFTGFGGAARPTLQTDGNFTTRAGDTYRMSDLFQAGAAAGQTIAAYRVALGDGGASGNGQLWLGGENVTGQTSFTADEFARLTYVSGTGDQQSLTVAAQSGTVRADGTLSGEIDSPAVQITANVTGVRSLNAMGALSTLLPLTDADAGIAAVATQAGIFTGWGGAARPTLQTGGNFTAKAGDTYRMSDLFQASAAAGQTIAGYRVALGDGGPSGGGQLWLGSENVTGQTSFTADEFARLTYVAGAGDQQSLTVAAQTGTRRADGTLAGEIDSAAEQITASVTGVRSLNAMGALSTLLPLTDADAGIASVAAQAGIFTGFGGAARPTLQTDGNFTAKAGDTYRMSDLFLGGATSGQTIAGYRVALGDGGPGGGGQLWLGGDNVTGQTSFTADEFARLAYVAGTGDQQSLTVAAQTGTPRADGTLSGEIDSPAVQITAAVTGVRSINAMGALSTLLPLTDPDSGIAAVASQAGIFTGFGGAARPTLQTALTPDPPVSIAALEGSVGTYRSAGTNIGGSDVDLSTFYSTAIGSSISPDIFTSPGGPLATALLLLGGDAVGAFRTADNLTSLAQAIRAYSTTRTL